MYLKYFKMFYRFIFVNNYYGKTLEFMTNFKPTLHLKVVLTDFQSDKFDLHGGLYGEN